MSPELTSLLQPTNPQQETISSVLTRMELVLAHFKTNPEYRHLVPFLETYYLVTKAVVERRIHDRHAYIHPDDLEKLDVYFASLYFKPLHHYLIGEPVPRPWQTYFEYCHQPNGMPFVQMLLGINAHINSDLLESLLILDYTHRDDYLLINSILEDIIPEVIRFLAFDQHDIFGIGGLFFKDFMHREFKNVVVRWRLNTWRNARHTRSHDFDHTLRLAHQQTEDLGLALIDIFNSISPLHTPSEILSRLHQLEVVIK